MEEGTCENSKEPLEEKPSKKPAEREAKATVEDLKIQLEEAQNLAKERLDQLLRSRAEMDNIQKRASREREDLVKYASERLICKILPVLDSLEQASKHDEGTRVLYQQLLDILKGEGLVPIEAVGQKFDPYKHEAFYQLKSDELEEGTVAEEIQKGYLLDCKVIRFSKVAVAKR